LCGEGVRPGFQGLQASFGFGEEPGGALMGRDELIERGGTLGQPADGLLEARQ